MSAGVQEDQIVVVIGAGTMGHGIATIAAIAGYRVRLNDVDASALVRAREAIAGQIAKAVEKNKLDAAAGEHALARIAFEHELKAACLDAAVVIEAAPERMDVKRDIFKKISAMTPTAAILATNTSSLSVTEIAAAALHPERVIGMHFFNPPIVLDLLEIVMAHQTSAATLAATQAVGERMKRQMVVVKDSPGFASSRLGVLLGLEAIRMVEQGVATAADIDKAMEIGYRLPMGPLRLTDLVGLDVRLAIAEHLHRELGGEQFRPPQLLKQMVRAGKLGRKSGEGFYSYARK